jgi:glucans biosynthesis protein
VQLVEIPTDDEINDNVCAYWLPKGPTRAGDALGFRYRLHWADEQPGFPAERLARVMATRTGRGGEPRRPRPRGVTKFCVEFLGGPLARPVGGAAPEPVIWVSRGSVSLVKVEPVPDGVVGHWRLFFDLAADGREPVELRAFLRGDGGPVSETWLYLFEVPPTA